MRGRFPRSGIELAGGSHQQGLHREFYSNCPRINKQGLISIWKISHADTTTKTRVAYSNSHLAKWLVNQYKVYKLQLEAYPEGAGIAQWLEHRTRDWKVAGSNPCWNGGRIFFSRVDFLCWLLFRYPFHPRVTTVARKKSRSFCQSAGGRLQLNTHTPYVCGFYWTVLRHWSQLVPNMSNDIWGH